MQVISNEDIIFIYSVLKKYSKVFSRAIEKQYEYLDEMYRYSEGIAGIIPYDKSSFKKFIEVLSGRIISNYSKLVTLNNLSAKITDVPTLIKFLYAYDIFELDKHVIPILQKQLKLKNIIKERGSISEVRLNAYSTIFGLLDDSYTECVKMLENCLFVLETEIKRRKEGGYSRGSQDLSK